MLGRSSVRAFAMLAFLALAACSSGGASKDPTPRDGGRTLLLITVENLRSDATLPPSAQGLVADGRTFTDVLSASPMARPSVASILTGAAPDRTGVRDSVNDRLPQELATLAERLEAAGWSTGGFVGSPSCAAESGLGRGFDLYDAPDQKPVGPGRLLPKVRPAATVAANAASWIAGLDAKADAFAWIHLADLQSVPFALDDMKTTPEAYATAVAALDAPIAAALDAAAKRGGREVVFAGTHGMYLGEEGKYGDAYWIDRETLAVPLVWTGGRAVAGRDDRPGWIPDIAATLAASAGVTLGEGCEGVDLGAAAPSGGRARPAWSWAPDDQEGWPTLASDGSRPATPRPRTLSAAARSRIQNAGVALGKTPKLWKEQPQGSEEIIQRLGRARWLLSAGRDGPARVTARQGLKTHPDDLGLLAIHLYISGGGTERGPVKETVEKLLRLYPDRQDALHWVGHYEAAAKRPEPAEALFQAALEVGPRDADLLYDLACSRSLAGDVPAALALLKDAVDAGFHEWAWMDKDADLSAVRADPGYATLRRAAGR